MTMEVLADWVSRISNVVWNGLLLYLLVGTGIVFTIRTRFIQVRKFGAGWKHLFGHFSLNGEKAGKDVDCLHDALELSVNLFECP